MFLVRFSRTLRLSFSLLGMLCFGAISTQLEAQTDSIPQKDRRNLSEMVIQATRTGSLSPVPHTNFSAERIAKEYHAQDVPYLLSSVPSLVETSDAGTGIGYSGLRIRGSDPSRTNVTLNGLPLNDAESQGVFWVNLPDLASSASEIQVQRGVGTSTNGAGAFGATLNLDLSKVATERFATVVNTLGSFGTRKHSAQLGTGLMGGKLALTARISHIQSDGFVERASVNLNAIHLSGAYVDEQQSAQFHVLSGREITYQAWNGLPAQYLDNESLRTFNVSGTERPGTPHPDEVDNYTQRHFLGHYKRVLSPAWQLQLNGHYTRGFGYFEQYKADETLADYGLPLVPTPIPVIPPMDLIRRRWLDNHFYGGTFALRWTPQQTWKPTFLLGGALSQYEGAHFGEVIWAESFTGAANDFRYYDNNAVKKDANLFLKVEARPTNQFTPFLDLQIRRVAYDFFGFNNELDNVQQTASLIFFNPKVGASYAVSNRWQAFAFLGVANREPNRDDYTQSSPESRPQAERLLDGELGMRGAAKNWSWSGNLFWMQYRNQLVLNGQINDVGAYIRTNVLDSWRAGIEMEGNVLISPRFSVAGSASYSQNKIPEFIEYRDNWDTGGQESIVHRNADLAFSPNWVARGEGTFVLLKPRNTSKNTSLSTTLVGKHVSRQFLDNTSNLATSLKGYFVSDWRINLDLNQIVGQQATFIFSVFNVFDEQYASNGWTYRYTSAGYDPRPDDPYTRSEGGNVYHQAGFFPQAGRNWMATLRLTF